MRFTDIADANEAYEDNPLHAMEADRERQYAAVATMIRPRATALLEDFKLALGELFDEATRMNLEDFAEDEGWGELLRVLGEVVEHRR